MGEEADPGSPAGVGPAAQRGVCQGHGGLGKGPPLRGAQLEPHAGLCCSGRRSDSRKAPGRAEHRAGGRLGPPLRCRLGCSGAARWAGGAPPCRRGQLRYCRRGVCMQGCVAASAVSQGHVCARGGYVQCTCRMHRHACTSGVLLACLCTSACACMRVRAGCMSECAGWMPMWARKCRFAWGGWGRAWVHGACMGTGTQDSHVCACVLCAARCPHICVHPATRPGASAGEAASPSGCAGGGLQGGGLHSC